MVKTRMYRSLFAMVEGWTKNLALLFRHPLRLAMIRALEFAVIIVATCAGAVLIGRQDPIPGLICLLAALVVYLNFLARIVAAHFPWKSNLAALWGLPFFSLLLLRSHVQSRVRGAVAWKGRSYPVTESHS
jgi:hypothetical protein